MPYEDNDISLYMTIGFNDNDVGGRLLKVIAKDIQLPNKIVFPKLTATLIPASDKDCPWYSVFFGNYAVHYKVNFTNVNPELTVKEFRDYMTYVDYLHEYQEELSNAVMDALKKYKLDKVISCSVKNYHKIKIQYENGRSYIKVLTDDVVETQDEFTISKRRPLSEPIILAECVDGELHILNEELAKSFYISTKDISIRFSEINFSVSRNSSYKSWDDIYNFVMSNKGD